jgi:hypothetical protein
VLFRKNELPQVKQRITSAAIVDENRVGREEAQWLQRTQIDFSAAGDADLFVGNHEAKHAACFQTLLQRQLFFEEVCGIECKFTGIESMSISLSLAERPGR